jgi:micrococcal nuclease
MARTLVAVALVALVVAAGCAGAGIGAGSNPTPSGGTVTVVEVVDGDTVEVEFADGRRDTARLLGVDTPEVHADNDPAEFDGVPDTEAGADCLRRWGERASAFARERLLGATVTLRFDDNEPRRGGYDRLLVYVVEDGELFNRKLVDQGYARVYDSEFTRRGTFYDLESTAQAEQRGLWTCREPGS